jgi:hypothetical protein
MISVCGSRDDYAIMKQVQQLKRAYPGMTIGTLDGNADFSRLAVDEKLFLVSHGNPVSGELNTIDTAELLGWLKSGVRGVPSRFGGIVISSCYAGLGGQQSLAHDVAQGLAGKAAAGTTVAGANGYSFGTPEFLKSGFSSVLPRTLGAFYNFAQSSMAEQWLAHKPTHDGGVLASQLKIKVDPGLTIQENLEASKILEKNPDAVKDQLARFALEAKGIEDQLKKDIQIITANSVAAVASTLISGNANAISSWNTAIARQYELYGDYYLWAPALTAFTVEQVP